MHEEVAQHFNLEGRVAVVTGAASGIGQESARFLAKAGAAIVAADVNEAGLAQTKADIEADGGKVVTRCTDVGQREEIEALAALAMTAFGQIDIWVNCAGTLIYKPIVEATPEDVDRLLDINLKSIYWSCAAAGRLMQKGGTGSIINIASTAIDTPVVGLSLYALTKSALCMLTRTAALEFGPSSIRVNAIAPGFVESGMTTFRYRNEKGEIDPVAREETLRERAGLSPLGITGTPRDMALAVLYLASDASRFVTGQVLRANGGVSMR